MWRLISTLALATAISPAHAECPPGGPPCWEIALYGDADCTTCNVSIPPFEAHDFYVKVRSNTGIGLLGAEFRIAGLPMGWLYTSAPDEFAFQHLGDPLDGSGCNIGFQTSQYGDCVPLYRVTVFSTTEAHDVALRVEHRDPPSSPNFECPRVVYSCPPCSASCAQGGTLYINSSNDCTVGIRAGTWFTVKSLYSE